MASTPVAKIGIILAKIAANGIAANLYQADSGVCLRNRIHGHFGAIGDVGDRGPIGSRKPKREESSTRVRWAKNGKGAICAKVQAQNPAHKCIKKF